MSYFEDNILFIKIKRPDGLYSKGGLNAGVSNYSWSKRGKMWQTLGSVRLHLNQYTDYTSKSFVNIIPKNWMVEITLKNSQVVSMLACKFYPPTIYDDIDSEVFDSLMKEHHKQVNDTIKDEIESKK